MTPTKVFFTGLELDPTILHNRVHYGIVPLDWARCRFNSETPIYQINEWLAENIEGRWAVLSTVRNNNREVTIAFEHADDGALFVISDGKTILRYPT